MAKLMLFCTAFLLIALAPPSSTLAKDGVGNGGGYHRGGGDHHGGGLHRAGPAVVVVGGGDGSQLPQCLRRISGVRFSFGDISRTGRLALSLSVVVQERDTHRAARPACAMVRSGRIDATGDRMACQRPALRLVIGVAVVSNCPTHAMARGF
jgi:hypothetical protein